MRGSHVSEAGGRVDEVRVVKVRLDMEPARIEELSARLSPDERARAGRFRFERDRRRFVACRGTLRGLLGEELGVAPESVVFAYGSTGKPRLAGELAASGLRFNVSHSGEAALIALARGREVGVDVEAVRPLSDAHGLALRYFASEEVEALDRLDPSDRLDGFFRCWTRKEAYLKAVGDGLSRRLDGFAVSVTSAEPRLLWVEGDAGEAERWRLAAVLAGDGLAASLAAEGPAWRLRITD